MGSYRHTGLWVKIAYCKFSLVQYKRREDKTAFLSSSSPFPVLPQKVRAMSCRSSNLQWFRKSLTHVHSHWNHVDFDVRVHVDVHAPGYLWF